MNYNGNMVYVECPVYESDDESDEMVMSTIDGPILKFSDKYLITSYSGLGFSKLIDKGEFSSVLQLDYYQTQTSEINSEGEI